MTALNYLNGCVFTAAAGGTGAFYASAAVSPYFKPSQCTNPSAVDAATYNYFAVYGSQYEIGQGVYTASGLSLSRSTILSSSNSGNVVNFTAAPKVFMGCALAGDMTGAQARENLGIPTITISSSSPSGGIDGDIWFKL